VFIKLPEKYNSFSFRFFFHSRDIIEIQSDEGEIERDALNIKPPQSQAGPTHREKSHKHKHKRDKGKDKQKQARDKDRERDREWDSYLLELYFETSA
jgi:hypothetical protein